MTELAGRNGELRVLALHADFNCVQRMDEHEGLHITGRFSRQGSVFCHLHLCLDCHARFYPFSTAAAYFVSQDSDVSKFQLPATKGAAPLSAACM